jgi:hypothetical protein
MLSAYSQYPNRFVNGKPVVRVTPDAAWINPPMVERVVAVPS